MNIHLVAGAITILANLVITSRYIRSIIRGETRPHMFSWLVWGIVLGIASAVAFVGSALISSIAVGVAALLCLTVGIMAARIGDKNITASDWVMLLLSLSIIPFWIMMKDPLAAAIAVTTVDALACGPTLRKAWALPHEESLMAFIQYIGISFFGFLSIDPLTWVTGMHPTGLVISNSAVVFVLLFRRGVVGVRLPT